MNEEKRSDAYETLGAPEIPAAKRKKSRARSQKIFITVIVSVIVLLGVAVGVISAFIAKTAVYIDSFSESKTSADGVKTSYVYLSKKTDDGIIIVGENDSPLDVAYAKEDGSLSEAPSDDRTPVYVTELGSLLTLTSAGKISYFAKVDYNGEAIGGDAGDRILVFPRVKSEDIAKLSVHNENGGYTLVNLSSGVVLEGYEEASVDRSIATVIFSLSGYSLTQKKLSIDVMRSIDAERGGEEGYIRIVGDDGRINFAEYGLDNTETYFELTDLSGKVYRLYIGDLTTDGKCLYVRYYDEDEGDRNAVYELTNDSGVGAMLNINATRASIYNEYPENLVYPQVCYPVTSTESAMVENFRLEKASGDGFKTVIAFSYLPLEERQYTFYQYEPYVAENGLLSGYELNDDLVSAVLTNFSDISKLMSTNYTDAVVKNYVRVEKLTPAAITEKTLPSVDDFETYDEYYSAFRSAVVSAADSAAAGELYDLLDSYGLAKPAFRCFYDSEKYSSGVLYTVMPNYIYISEKTSRNTYYVWAPIYRQIVEIGDMYLKMLDNIETTDWTGSYVYRKNVLYCDSFEVKGRDADGVYHDYLFDLENSANVTVKTTFVPDYEYSTVTGGSYTTKIVRTYSGEKKITVSIGINYTGVGLDENGNRTESTFNYSDDLVASLGLSTVKNFAKSLNDSGFYGEMSVSERTSLLTRICSVCTSYDVETAAEYLDSYLSSGYFSSLSFDEKAAICRYLKQSVSTFRADYPPTVLSNGIAVVHVVKTVGDEYGYVPSKDFLLLFSYNEKTDKMRLTVGSTDGGSAAIVFDEETFDNYIASSVSNNGEVSLTASEKTSVEAFRRSITQLTSTTDVIRLREYDENGELISSRVIEPTATGEGDNYVSAFKMLYQTLLYATYPGHAGVEEIIGGKYLTEEEMAAFEASDEFDLELTIKTTFNNASYTFRTYGYSATKSLVTVNGKGIFYLYDTRVEKLMSDAAKAFSGDKNITPDVTY